MPRHCSSQCMPKPDPRPRSVKKYGKCTVCGGPARTKRNLFCGNACKVAAQRALRPAAICRHCGVTFRRRKGSRDQLKYCARQCAFAALARRSAERKALVVEQRRRERHHFCPVCGRQSATLRCGPEHEARWALISACRSAAPVACKVCGAVYCAVPGAYARAYCSLGCKAAAKRAARKMGRRASKALRRARQRVDRVLVGRSIDPIRVFDECGWRCALCNRKTPKEKRGAYDDDAPELDHIVALSRGGSHTRANLQLACRACNLKKGAQARGQLWLEI